MHAVFGSFAEPRLHTTEGKLELDTPFTVVPAEAPLKVLHEDQQATPFAP